MPVLRVYVNGKELDLTKAGTEPVPRNDAPIFLYKAPLKKVWATKRKRHGKVHRKPKSFIKLINVLRKGTNLRLVKN